MLSRVAEAIYWMNRYVERAENVARFIDVNLYLHLDAASFAAPQWQPLVSVTGDNALFQELYSASNRENVIRFLTLDYRNPNSIVSCLRAARENARSVREVISSEMWEQINRFYLEVNSADADGVLGREPYAFFSGIKSNAHLLNGITEATMTHGEAWHFGRLGRMIERAENLLRDLGFRECRVRHHDNLARIEVPADQIPRIIEVETRSRIDTAFREFGYTYVTIDLRGFRSGSLNEVIAFGKRQSAM